MIPMKTVLPTPRIVAYVKALREVIAQHTDLTAEQMLAGAAQLVGSLIALQDQRKFTTEIAMVLVLANIEEGNRVALETVSGAGGVAN